ncbi:MAG: hypothetical protein KGL16_13990, partial [Acidobacteriota bacterium]|nr:hypothetical protein [Acidobacteriota bacterium]
GAPQPGRLRCLARVLTVRRTGRAATLLTVQRAGATAAAAAAAPQQYTAGFLQWAYDTTWLSANAGASDTVAIVDAYGDPTAYGDMQQFRSANGLRQIPTCSSTVTTRCFAVVNQNGQTSPLPTAAWDETGSWNIEESLDIDAVSSLCPLCKIVMVEANSDDWYGNDRYGHTTHDLETAVSTAATLGANQISLSWGGPTTPGWSAYASPYSSIASASILAASGDSAYQGANTVDYPAALPDVTAVGGTSLSADASVPRGFDESAWPITLCSGKGCQSQGTGSGCDTSQVKPSYQSGVATGCPGRGYNDISADADPNTGLNIYDSQPGAQGCGTPSNTCIVGGTSLATPLTAAIEAVTGVSDTTPAWTYGDASLLNDIVAGSNGTCPSGAYLICNAGIGWDGPTGNGSISGDVATGGPGIGGSSAAHVNATDATLAGGVYPNGEPTSYQWRYWPSSQPSSSGAPTPAAPVSGRTLQQITTTVCTLTPATTYDFQLTASNGSGSETGPQGSFTTPATGSAPTTSTAAAIQGSPVTGQTLTGVVAWNEASCNSAPSYQWQEAPAATGPWTTVGTAQTYALTSADLGAYLRFTSSETNAVGTTTSSSAAVGPVTAPAVTTTTTPTPTPTTTTPTTTRTTATPTTTTRTTTTPSTTGRTGATTTVRFYRCIHACVPIRTRGAKSYRPTRADYGRYIKVVTTVTRTSRNVRKVRSSTRWLGPVTAATAGDVGFGLAARPAAVTAVRGATGRALAQVRIEGRRGNTLRLRITRAGRAPTQAWAYVVARGARVSGTTPRSLRRPLTLNLTLARGQTVMLVAVRT